MGWFGPSRALVGRINDMSSRPITVVNKFRPR